MTLSDWLERGWLVTHRPDRREIKHLLGIADRDIADSRVRESAATQSWVWLTTLPYSWRLPL